PEERARFLDILERDTRRLSQLVRRLLELARADVMPGAAETCDAAATLQLVGAGYRDQGLTLEQRPLAGALPARISADVLGSILVTLFDNVRTHGGAAAHVALDADARGGFVEINLEDDGPGVSANNRPRIFEPFFTTARDRGGTGLGLSIARSLARAHGGDL